MGTKTKITLAASFVGVVAMAAAAFGQTGGSGSDEETRRDRRRAGVQEHRDGCGPDHAWRLGRRLVHSDAKVQVKDGFAVVTVDQGKVTAVDHSDKEITIERADGEKVTATATDETNVCKDGAKAAFDSIKVGDHARLFQIRSDERSGLRRIAVRTPGSEEDSPAAGRAGALGEPLDPAV